MRVSCRKVRPGSIVSGPDLFLESAKGRLAGGKTEEWNPGSGWIDEARHRRQPKDVDEEKGLGWLRELHHGERERCGARSWIRTR